MREWYTKPYRRVQILLRLGSLFSGSGGFELAGVLHGIEPVWASEIEPFPIRVTKNRFPNMKHLGSVTDVNGAEVEPVDIITFGSPCQDLSVAGKQAGIHDGQRSNLFFEAIRIIKEMRDGTADKFPRFAVWENVPGAFSSNKGRDFQAVLQALCDIRGGQGHIVPLPPKGKWLPAGCIVGDGWSVAWRVYDAQFWGVPQRRKRIYLIADFGSERAGEILFERESVRGDSAESGEAREGTSADSQGSVGRSDYACGGMIPLEESAFAWTYRGREGCCNVEMQKDVSYCLREPAGGGSQPNVCYKADGVKCLNPLDCQSKRQYTFEFHSEVKTPEIVCYEGQNVCCDSQRAFTLQSGRPDQQHIPSVVYRQDGFAGYSEGVGTLKASGGDIGGVRKASSLSVFDARGNGNGETVPTITGDHQNRVSDYTCICVERNHDE